MNALSCARRSRTSNALSLFIVPAAVAALLLAGCAQDAGDAAPPQAPPPSSSSAPPEAEPRATEAAPEAPAPLPEDSEEPAPETETPDPETPPDVESDWRPEEGGDGPVAPEPLPTVEAELGDAVVFDTGVDVDVVRVEATQVEAETPGEVSGPAVVVTVAARNQGTEPVAVDSAVVTVVASDGELGIGTTAGAPSPLTGSVEPGGTAEGTYVFMLDASNGRELTVSVNYAAGEPVAVFTGKAS